MDDMQTPQIEAQPAWLNLGYEWRGQWPMGDAWVRPSLFRTAVPALGG
jgi:hypothetical protein